MPHTQVDYILNWRNEWEVSNINWAPYARGEPDGWITSLNTYWKINADGTYSGIPPWEYGYKGSGASMIQRVISPLPSGINQWLQNERVAIYNKFPGGSKWYLYNASASRIPNWQRYNGTGPGGEDVMAATNAQTRRYVFNVDTLGPPWEHKSIASNLGDTTRTLDYVTKCWYYSDVSANTDEFVASDARITCEGFHGTHWADSWRAFNYRGSSGFFKIEDLINSTSYGRPGTQRIPGTYPYVNSTGAINMNFIGRPSVEVSALHKVATYGYYQGFGGNIDMDRPEASGNIYNFTPMGMQFRDPTEAGSYGGYRGRGGPWQNWIWSQAVDIQTFPWNPPHVIIPGGCCFRKGTGVFTKKGNKNIERFKVGDKVLNDTGEHKVIRVEEVSLNDRALYTFNKMGTYFVTEDHFIKTRKGWKSVNPGLTEKNYPNLIGLLKGKIEIGDEIQMLGKEWVKVTSIDRQPEETRDPRERVYELTIEDDPTFYANGILVHNHYWNPPWNPWVPRPPDPPNPPRPPTNPTTTTLLSCADCAPCAVTSKPYVKCKTDSNGTPTSAIECNVTKYPPFYPRSSVLLSIRAPIKHYGYRQAKIYFWASINENGRLVGLSEPRYNDKTTLNIYRDLIKADDVEQSPSTLPQETPTDQFNTYKLMPQYVARRESDRNQVKHKIETSTTLEQIYDEHRLISLKDDVGTIEFNPVTQKFQNVQLTTYDFTTLSRSITAANYDQTNYSMFYVPSDGHQYYQPLLLADGTQNIAWKQQGSGYSANTEICYEVEWLTTSAEFSGYEGTVSPLGTLDARPEHIVTTLQNPATGHTDPSLKNSGVIPISHNLYTNRSNTRIPLAGPSIIYPQHGQGHEPRNYGLYNESLSCRPFYVNQGYAFPVSLDKSIGNYRSLSAREFRFTRRPFRNTTVPTVTASRLKDQFCNSTAWDIADFSWFVHLSAADFARFLVAANQFTVYSPLTASYEALIPLAFCTYNGSLTAADGKYYCAAIARSNPPSWCTPITSISTASPYASSFVVLTSGCDLVLPYLCYMQTLSWGTY